MEKKLKRTISGDNEVLIPSYIYCNIAKKKVGERLKTCHNIKSTDAASATVCYFI